MDLKILKRRAEMLDAVSTGLHPSAVVAQLAEKYGVTERALSSSARRLTSCTLGSANELSAPLKISRHTN